MRYATPQISRSRRSRIFNRRILFGTFATLAILALITSTPRWSRDVSVKAVGPDSFFGAIYTSLGDGTAVNHNVYDAKQDVYLNGGPQNQNGNGLPNGTYYFQVTNPSGSVLLSTDPAECRQLVVANGVVSGPAGPPCQHAPGTLNLLNGSIPVQLVPFNDTPNAGGEYKVHLIRQTDDTSIDAEDPTVIHFLPSDSKTDNFKVKENPVTPQSAIGGVKWIDTNHDGVLDLDTETDRLENVTINITFAPAINGETTATTTTAADGSWALVFPEGTTYTACEAVPDGYTQTGPNSGAEAADQNNNPAATADASRCWVGTVTGADTSSLNFGNIICTVELSCPDDVELECGSDTTPDSTGKATGSSNCGAVDVTFSDSFEEACGNTGVITRTWTATDQLSGNSTSCKQKITIVDKTAPTFDNCPTDVDLGCNPTSIPGAANVTASDTCGTATVTPVVEDSADGCDHTRTITYTAEDACGNKNTCVQRITWTEDTTGPQIVGVGDSATVYCPSTPTFSTPEATDGCGGAQITGFVDNRVEGSCDTYAVTRTWTAQDDCGNKTTASQTIEVRCNNCGEGTMGFWQNKNGQGLIKSADQASLKAFLTGYNPFNDLTTQVIATYVTNIIKAASSSGAAMNAMLKAQMLSTALDVYFGKVDGNAPIDLTFINKPIGSLTYENVSSSFGGANCLSVYAMLTHASNQSNSGGSIWYLQVKNGPNSQELAKDAFDAINNQKAFSVLSCP